MMLNLGCGRDYRDGFVNVDHQPDIPVRIKVDEDVDLNGPWPWDDNSVDKILANNIFEHLDDMMHVMAESHRVLKPDGAIQIMGPADDGPNWCAGPTHKRAFNVLTFDCWDPGTTLGAKAWNFWPKWKVVLRKKLGADWAYVLEPRL